MSDSEPFTPVCPVRADGSCGQKTACGQEI
jgi:hypothetical protein